MSTEPIELVAKTTGKTVGFICGACSRTNMTMFAGSYLGTDEEQFAGARHAAAECCGPWFCGCGKERRQFWRSCDVCSAETRAADRAAKEKVAFEAAEKIPADAWTGSFVWSERYEAIFGNLDDLVERHVNDGQTPPAYARDCDKYVLSLCARDILEGAVEQHEFHEGAEDDGDVGLLQWLLDAWSETNEIACWKPNEERAVLLPASKEDA